MDFRFCGEGKKNGPKKLTITGNFNIKFLAGNKTEKYFFSVKDQYIICFKRQTFSLYILPLKQQFVKESVCVCACVSLIPNSSETTWSRQ